MKAFNYLQRLVLSIIMLGAAVAAVAASPAHALTDETLNYKVMFKWGIIQKQAGRATLQLKAAPGEFVATLYARSEPWADHFYSLRDTLTSHMSHHDYLPTRYERIAHEDGTYARDVITMTQTGTLVTGHSVRYRRKKKETALTSSEITLEAEGPTVDLLSVFYYIRTIDFHSLSPGYQRVINIFSGKRKELLTIKFHGTETLDLDGVKYPTFHISFTFSDEKSSKTSDDIDTWIWANQSRIPLKLEGKLKVGKIRCLYTGSKP